MQCSPGCPRHGRAPAGPTPLRAGCPWCIRAASRGPCHRDRQRRVVRERQTHFELGRLHVETLVPQRVGHVVDAGVVAWCAEGAVAAVGVGDLLQLLQVRHHRIGGHPLLQRRGEVRGGRRRCGGGRLCLLGRIWRPQPPSATTATTTVSTARDFRTIATTLAPAYRSRSRGSRFCSQAAHRTGFPRGPRRRSGRLRDDEVGDRPHAVGVGVQRRRPAG